jgi:hypothetical protein
MKLFLLLILCIYSVAGCDTDAVKPKKVEVVKELDTIVQAQSAEDAVSRASGGVSVSQAKEEKQNAMLIEKKYGEQWDFCTCVLANDSITDAFEKKISSSQETKLMARWDYVDKKCKELTTFDQTNPDQRAAHERKVTKCLKAANRKK